MKKEVLAFSTMNRNKSQPNQIRTKALMSFRFYSWFMTCVSVSIRRISRGLFLIGFPLFFLSHILRFHFFMRKVINGTTLCFARRKRKILIDISRLISAVMGLTIPLKIRNDSIYDTRFLYTHELQFIYFFFGIMEIWKGRAAFRSQVNIICIGRSPF